jgi:hypothetical protein
MSSELAGFSLNDFLEHRLPRRHKAFIEAEVIADGDHVIVDFTPGEAIHVYRIHRQYVEVDSAPIPVQYARGEKVLHRVAIAPDAPCVRLTVGFASEFLPIESAFLPLLQAKITFRANGEGTLKFGSTTVPCLGKPNLAYPVDLSVRGIEGTDKFLERRSEEFGVMMPFAVLIWGQRGIFIHEGPDNLDDNGGPSQGCVHIATGSAKTFYDWVSGPTRIQISHPW